VDFSSSEDLDFVIKHIKGRYPEAPMYLVGFSMGSIQSMMWLAQQKGKKDNPVKGFVAISCPVSLSKAVPHLSQWKNIIYANNMTKAMLKIAEAHSELVEDKKLDVDFGSRS
jgi:predicted alpha/beta-fold hydrolase